MGVRINGVYYVRGTQLNVEGKKERDQRQYERQKRKAEEARRDAEKFERRMERNEPASEPSGPRLVETTPNLAKVKIYPLGLAIVAAGAPFSLNPTAQHIFEPTRIIFSGNVSLSDIELNELKIGNVSQLVVGNTVFPAQMFSPAADDVLCDLDVVTTGQDFLITGTSVSAQRVTAGSYGNYFQSVNLRRAR